jgi:hypothetical protein
LAAIASAVNVGGRLIDGSASGSTPVHRELIRPRPKSIWSQRPLHWLERGIKAARLVPPGPLDWPSTIACGRPSWLGDSYPVTHRARRGRRIASCLTLGLHLASSLSWGGPCPPSRPACKADGRRRLYLTRLSASPCRRLRRLAVGGRVSGRARSFLDFKRIMDCWTARRPMPPWSRSASTCRSWRRADRGCGS